MDTRKCIECSAPVYGDYEHHVPTNYCLEHLPKAFTKLTEKLYGACAIIDNTYKKLDKCRDDLDSAKRTIERLEDEVRDYKKTEKQLRKTITNQEEELAPKRHRVDPQVMYQQPPPQYYFQPPPPPPLPNLEQMLNELARREKPNWKTTERCDSREREWRKSRIDFLIFRTRHLVFKIVTTYVDDSCPRLLFWW